MALTLNQVISRLESLANSHRQIATVFTGSLDKFLSQDRVYPCCFIEQQKRFNISATAKETFFTFRFHFLDLMDVSANAEENHQEITSDQVSIAQDYMAMLLFNDYLMGENSWSISYTTGEIVDYKLHDICAGAMIEVQIGTRFNANRCQVPADAVIFENDIDMKVITNYIYAVVAEVSTVTIPALIDKEIVQMHIGDKLGVPITDPVAILSANEYRYTYNTGLFEFGTVLQPEQVLQILNRNI